MNPSKILVMSSVVGLTLLGAGCQNPITAARDRAMERVNNAVAEKIIEVGSEGRVQIDTANGRVTATGEDGQKATFGQGATFPSNMASDVPTYAGATNAFITFDPSGKNGGYTQTTTDAPDRVYANLSGRIIASGFTKSVEQAIDGGYTASFKKGNVTIGLVIGRGGSDPTTTITLSRAEQQ